MRLSFSLVLVLPICLILLQVSDFALTWLLLEGNWRTDIYEANPLARGILLNRGWLGLAGFKAACTFVAVGASFAICLYRPLLGRLLFTAQCLAMTLVVAHSLNLLLRSHQAPIRPDEGVVHDTSICDSLKALQQFSTERTELCRQINAGQVDLKVGVTRMRNIIQRLAPHIPTPQRKNLPQLQDSRQMARFLYHHCAQLLEGSRDERARMNRLTAQMHRHFPDVSREKENARRRHDIPSWVLMSSPR